MTAATTAAPKVDDLRLNGWTPVERESPRLHHTVLIFNAEWEDDPVWCGWWNGREWKSTGMEFDEFGDQLPPPTHWMEKPPVPEAR